MTMNTLQSKHFLKFAIIWGVCLALTSSCQPQKQGPSKPTPPAPSVSLYEVTKTDFTRYIKTTGTVEAERSANLASPIEGPVVMCWVSEGDSVSTGQPLITIGRSQASVAALRAAEEEFARVENDYLRVQKLVEQKALPSEQLELVTVARQKAHAALAQVQQTASDFEIVAPWDGIVATVPVSEGTYVSPRQPLISLFDPNQLTLRFQLPEEYSGVTPTSDVQASFDALPGKVHTITVTRIWPSLNEKSRTRTLEASLDSSIPLTPGMFARIRFPIEVIPDALVIPTEALRASEKGSSVFVFNEGKVLQRPVGTTWEQDGMVAITEGIKEGDQIVLNGIERVSDGKPVRVKGKGTPSPAEKTPAI